MVVAILVIIAIVFVLFIEYMIAKEFYNVAVLKGYTEKKYLWLCFFLSIVGYLLVIALPNRGVVSVKNDIDIDELPEI